MFTFYHMDTDNAPARGIDETQSNEACVQGATSFSSKSRAARGADRCRQTGLDASEYMYVPGRVHSRASLFSFFLSFPFAFGVGGWLPEVLGLI